MQRHDPNGLWLEWLEEIKNEESTFDKQYVLKTLEEWFYGSDDEVYKNMHDLIRNL